MDVKTANASPRRSLVRALRKRGCYRGGGVRHRLLSLLDDRHPWYDWGHRLMILTGSDDGGSWSEPEPPTWWYRLGAPKRMRRTGYPRHPLSTFEVVTDYDEFRGIYDPLDEDGRYEWRAFAVDQDGDLILGHRYWGGTFYGMTKPETALLLRYLRMWRRHDWYGLRSWLYSQGLHAAVNLKVPFTCQEVPPKGTGGYSHWYCRKPRRHSGDHRYNNYTWADGRTEYRPVA